MIDLAPLRKFEVYGQDAEALMQYAITKDVRKLFNWASGLLRDVL